MGAPSVWSVVLFTSRLLPFRCFRGPPETPLGKAKGEEESPWEAGSVHMLQKYKTKQNKKKKNPFSLSALVTSSPRTNRLLSPLLLSLFFFFFLLFLLFFILVCAEARDWHQMSSSMAHLFLEAESRWTWRLLTSDSPGDACAHPSFVSASWVLGLQADLAIYLAIMWALSILRLAEQTISPQDHQQILQGNREKGCMLLLMAYYGRNLGIKDAPWKRWPQYSSDSQLHRQGMRPLGKDTQPWSPDWLGVSLLVQLMKTENLCLHRYTLSCELWYSRDAGQPKQSPLCLLLRDISPRREIWPLSKWNENLVFYMWKPIKQEISTISHKMNLNTIDDILY